MSQVMLWQIHGCEKDTAKAAVSFNNKNILPSYAAALCTPKTTYKAKI